MKPLESSAPAVRPSQVDRSGGSAADRRTRQIPMRENVQLRWRDHSAVTHEETVTVVVDASASGLGFLTNMPVREGDFVTLRTDRRRLDCVVRYVRDLDGRRYVGVEVRSGSDRTDIAKSVQRLKQALATSRRASISKKRR